ncbi:MAG TPA: dipeptide epimerase [Rhodospirillaceae bacterium]|nr:dipeptide epimerase [Rhodospirillaceae bacterium]
MKVRVSRQSFPIRGTFRLSRGAKTAAEVVVVEIAEGGAVGRGEAVPYKRYGETVDGVIAAIAALGDGVERSALQRLLPPGAARNALDCALWDLEAKRTGRPAWKLAGLPPPRPLTTAYTLSLDSPAAMAAAAAGSSWPILKLKLGAEGDLERVLAVRQAAPAARLWADANEAWSIDYLRRTAADLAGLGVELIEQPLPAAEDEALRGWACPVALAADESFHIAADLPRLQGLYQAVNVKLDKTGGLTEALAAVAQAKAAGFAVMVGCMVASSLAMAPAALLAAAAGFVDLDGPLLLDGDRSPGLRYSGAVLYPPEADLWG